MIKTLIFDFGDVFINLDKQGAMKQVLELFKLETLSDEIIAFNCLYEQGLISTEEFIAFYLENFPDLDEEDVLYAWNCILKDFPEHRLEFIKKLAKENRYTLILLSNTNELHIDCIKERVSFYNDFKNCFHKFYLSHEIQLRKPDSSIYNFVLKENNLNPTDCLFIDDTFENTEAAKQLGMHVWNIDETSQDIVDLFTAKKEFF
ncbi:HAD-IA family hydrolase [Xanthomarina sp. GH4-25]|uniref:HAD-IA family hydrolase n=1 Tax=Xanthomarina sp. GH4-25 TaxID=3349335 RepID=UPI003877E849